MELAVRAVELVSAAAGAGNVQQMLAATPDPLDFGRYSALIARAGRGQGPGSAGSRQPPGRATAADTTIWSTKCKCSSLRQKIAEQAQTEMSKEQREYLLRQQMRAIQEELGEQNPEQAEVAELRRRCRRGPASRYRP